MKTSDRFTHPRFERAGHQIVFVLKTGVLGWGVTCAMVMFLVQSYQRNAWVLPRDFVPSLIMWCLAGIVFGVLQLRTARARDRVERCAECGAVPPNHTDWCVAVERQHEGAA
jgi:hypothetical protein